MLTANHKTRYLLHFLLFFSCCFSGTNSDELQILLKLKKALQSPNSDVLTSWNSNSSVCKFIGIVCDPTGLVTEIELSNQGLTGSVLPFDSICQLKNLKKLSLGFNSLKGKIGKELNNCVNLNYLDLGNNYFTGPVPEIPSLSQLQSLHLNNSGFSGVFPWSSIQNTTSLIVLSVGDNLFDPTDFPEEVVNLRNLTWLYMSNCSIEGKIPAAIGNLVKLENLELADNNLSGEIPTEIGQLNKLWQLELYDNVLTGKLPVGIRNLTKLRNFDASSNFLQGDLSELRFLTGLVSLQLYENKFWGEIPVEFGQFKNLVNLSLYTNNLTGPVPQELGSWAEFDFIDVSENFLSGPIPPDMCKKGAMKELLMLQNRLTGEIPASYANCLSLERFRVSNNSLSGEIPAGLWGLPELTIIDLSLNQFQGPIASDVKNAKKLAQLFTGYNQFSGELPMEITKAESLVAIELNDNKFSGNIPGSIGELKRLSSLQLQNNMLSGSIPEGIGSCVKLSDLNMAKNSLGGGIPRSLGYLPTLNSLNLSDNKLLGEIPHSLSSLRLSLLDLSNNKLSGPIPRSLSNEAYNGSFAGNPGLCSTSVSSFRLCSSNSRDIRTLIICFSLGTLILLVSVGCYLYLKRKEKEQERSLKEESWDVKSFHVLSFTEDEIIDSIKEENLIGSGGSGNVYKVSISNGKEFAVKHIYTGTPRGKSKSTTPMLGKQVTQKSKEFEAEVHTLSSIRHINVVKLYCSITSEDSSLLVYEYMPNGSLWEKLHLCKKSELNWETRHEIAVGAAKGLEYLHHGCERPVIHRDVKSSNILLDEFLKPRIADFGLAKIVQANSVATGVVAGTIGYIAPEFGYTYKVNEKIDVYSFGVVLMELVTGKEAVFEENKDIVSWVCGKLTSREAILSIVDSRIAKHHKEEAIKVLRIAVLCTARSPILRPTMKSVVQMLEEADPCKFLEIVVGNDDKKKEMVVT